MESWAWDTEVQGHGDRGSGTQEQHQCHDKAPLYSWSKGPESTTVLGSAFSGVGAGTAQQGHTTSETGQGDDASGTPAPSGAASEKRQQREKEPDGM